MNGQYEQLRQVERQCQLLQEMKSSLHTARSQIHHMNSNEGAEPVQIQLFNSLFQPSNKNEIT